MQFITESNYISKVCRYNIPLLVNVLSVKSKFYFKKYYNILKLCTYNILLKGNVCTFLVLYGNILKLFRGNL